MPSGVNDSLARMPFPHSYQHIQKFTPNRSAMMKFLAPYARQSACYFEDDFLGDTLNLDHYALAQTADTNDTLWAKPATDLVGGVITGVTGANTADTLTICGYPQWAGDNNCWVEVRADIDNFVDSMLEFGFINTLSDKKLTAVNDIDTPSINTGGTNVAVLAYDYSQTLKTFALVTDGSTSNMNTTALTVSPVFSPTNATMHTYMVCISGDYALAMIDGKYLTATSTGAIGQRVEGGTLESFWIAARTRTSAARTVNIDYIRAGQDRAVRVA